MTGAFARAFLVVVLIATPSILLSSTTADIAQVVILVAILAGALTFFEYTATYPGLIEFRDAPPFNRIRFFGLFLAVFLLTNMISGLSDPTMLSEIVTGVALTCGRALDFPFSPVRLLRLVLPDGAPGQQVLLVQSAAGLAYVLSLMTIGAFLGLMRLNQWPRRSGSFNVWINLPTFDPTAGDDVIARLIRAASINIVMGVLLPFLLPAALQVYALAVSPVTFSHPQTLIWTVSAWALLPASLVMRGVALRRIAELILEQRRRAVPAEEEGVLQPA